MDFAQEKRDSQELLRIFVTKLHAFEIQSISKDGYVQFIHLVSQIVQHTNYPVDTPNERLRILPTQGILRNLVQSWSESMDEEKIRQIVQGDTQPEEATKK